MSIKPVLCRLWAKLRENSTFGTLYRLGLFLFLYFIGKYFIIFLKGSALISTLLTNLHQPFLWFIDKVSTGFMGIFYTNLTSSHDFIVIINNIQVIQLFPGCSGLHNILRITFVLLLYPIPWKTKTWLFPLSYLIIIFAAIIHFIILILIAYHWPEYYSFNHNYFSRVVFYGFYFLTWLIWEKVGYQKEK